MDEGLIKAAGKVGIRLASGMLVISAVLGICVLTLDSGGINGEIAELEAVEEALVQDAEERGVEAPERVQGDSLLARIGAAVRQNLPLAMINTRLDADRLVSCRLGSSTQFTRAADCLSRGGDPTDLKPRN